MYNKYIYNILYRLIKTIINRGNYLGDDATEYLANGIEKLIMINTLSLEFNVNYTITENGVKYLAEAI